MPLRNAVISVGECPGLNPYILGFGGVSRGGFGGGGVVWYGCVGGVGGLVCFPVSVAFQHRLYHWRERESFAIHLRSASVFACWCLGSPW